MKSCPERKISECLTILIILTVFTATGAGLLQASSDVECPPPLTSLIGDTAALRCMAGIGNAVLNPYNDSQVNLLLATVRPAGDQKVDNTRVFYWDTAANKINSPFYIQSFNPPASSPEESGTDDSQFLKLASEMGLKESAGKYDQKRALDLYNVIRADSLLDENERRQIMSYFWRLIPAAAATAKTGDYFHYISAANSFHADDYDTAQKLFAALTDAKTAWVKEASLYNLIRIAIRQTQRQSTDNYGFFDPAKADKVQAAKILSAIERYLREFPRGRYADSALQLKRRAYWLAGDNSSLAKSFPAAINNIRRSNDLAAAARLAAEIDSKYLASAPEQIEWDDPVLAAAQILLRLRRPALPAGKESYKPVARGEIQAHENSFRKQDAASLYQYLLLAYDFFDREDYAVVVQKTENWQAGLAAADYAAFSSAALRAEALGRLQRWPEAAVLLTELRQRAPSPLLTDHFELAQAQNLEAAGKTREIFAPQSVITSPVLRKRVIRAAADTRLLEYILEQKHITPAEKALALAALLNRELFAKQFQSLRKHQQKYAALHLADVDGLNLLRSETISSDDNFACPQWSDVLQDLNRDKVPPHALLCLGERLRMLEDRAIGPLAACPGELGQTGGGFAAAPLTRLSLYLTVMNDAASPGDDVAYALRRSLYCFATSGSNHCGREQITPAERKAWFTRLKTKYKKSPWAGRQEIYW